MNRLSIIFSRCDKATTERQVFQEFYESEPSFAGRPLRYWELGPDPPDILCHDFSGKCIGVELSEWLDETAIKSAKQRKKLHDSFLGIIRSHSETPPRNIENVRIGPKTQVPVGESEEAKFRCEFFDFIRRTDAARNDAPDRGSQPCTVKDFPDRPTLSKYIAWIRYFPCRPSGRMPGIAWVGFEARGNFYDPRAMLGPLIKTISKKVSKYGNLRELLAVDELCLVVYYSQALLYSPPYSAPGFGIREVANLVMDELAQNHGLFQKVFLFSPVEKNNRVLQVWPFNQKASLVPPPFSLALGSGGNPKL